MQKAPEWMLRLSRSEPIVNAFLRLGEREGFTADLLSRMAESLAMKSVELNRIATDAVAGFTPPVWLQRQ